MTGFVCPLCECEGEVSREHVLPEGLDDIFVVGGPFTTEVNGEPLLRRDGAVRRTNVTRYLLDVCEDRNGWLDKHFEKPGQGAVRAVFTGETIEAEEVDAFARWVIKTVLLLLHPNTRRLSDGYEAVIRARPPWAADFARRLRDTGDIPEEISVWTHTSSETAPVRDIPPLDINLQRGTALGVSFGERETGNGHLLELGIPTSNGRRLGFHIVFHDVRGLANPWEALGYSVQLWPTPPQVLDPNSMTDLDPNSVSYLRDWAHGRALGPPEMND